MTQPHHISDPQILKPHYFVLWTNCLRLSILDRDQKDKIMRQKYYDKQKSWQEKSS